MKPAIWLIALIVGLPQLCETVYTPSLPDIAHALRVSESMVEYTLTIYLFAFAIGTLFWGKLSDKHGRKPCIIAGLIIFALGCVGCYFSETITHLMISRFVQAFGGSIGSVLGQALCRDTFHGPALGKVYATIGSALGLFPAIGPVVGGFIAENFGWPLIFVFLFIVSMVLIVISIFKLPETHHDRKPIPILQVAKKLFRDKNVMGLGLLVAGCNGISFSYYAEGPFYLISLLGLSPSVYGLTFLAIALSTILGGFYSKRLQASLHAKIIHGLNIILYGSAFFSVLMLFNEYCFWLPKTLLIVFSLLSQMTLMFGICVTTSNALALSLADYKWCIGTASSLFGFFYYVVISLFTLGMGTLHNGTLLPMPLYFLGISIFMVAIKKGMIRN